MAIRKSVTSLTAEEKRKYIDGVKALKANRRNSGAALTIYDDYVRLHGDNRGGAHAGPAFLPWHREYILRFELDLQEALNDPNFGLPYWDWAADAALGDATDPIQASIWRNDFMGGDGNPVGRGPFTASEWTTSSGGPLIRGFGDPNDLATQDHVNATIRVTPYDQAPFHSTSAGGPSFRKQLEGFIGTSSRMHNGIHVWIGGSNGQMSSVPIAPNDPVFWLHHCNIDRIWALWDVCRPAGVDQYLPTSGANTGHNLNDPMVPFEVPINAHPRRSTVVRPSDVLDITNLQDENGVDISYSYADFHRRFIRLQRTTGNRFVSTQVIEVSSRCDSRNDTATTIFLPAASGAQIRARFEQIQSGANTGDVTVLETVTDEITIT
jgi:tyrosinase